MTVNREHKPVHIATLDPYAKDKVSLAGFSPEVQRETLDAAKRFWSSSSELEAEQKDKATHD